MSKTQYRRVPSASNFKEQVAISGGWLNSKYKNEFYKNQRFETAAEKYKEIGKKQKVPVLIASKRVTELEDTKWNDKVFTGESNKNAAELTFYARQREMQKNDKLPGRKKTIDPTVGERLFRTSIKNAARELLKPQNNLEGVVDLKHVNDIRRVLRLRYASRTNIDKIFSTYDADGKGFVDARDIASMSEHLGIVITHDQAQVLIQSAKDNKESGKGLSVEEFSSLMFDCEDKLYVDLKILQPYNEKTTSKPPTGYSIKAGSEHEVENQLKFYI
jgi:hypothetical protein